MLAQRARQNRGERRVPFQPTQIRDAAAIPPQEGAATDWTAWKWMQVSAGYKRTSFRAKTRNATVPGVLGCERRSRRAAAPRLATDRYTRTNS